MAEHLTTVHYVDQPYFGSILLNPIHLLVPLFSVPLQFAYIFGLMRPQGYRPSF
ncbi:MAG: hypothetical protein FWG54_03340 [Bacteroidetes bacterium]|nr:hypothetical protein [Bacteroidota bacterium]